MSCKGIMLLYISGNQSTDTRSNSAQSDCFLKRVFINDIPNDGILLYGNTFAFIWQPYMYVQLTLK